MPFKRFSPHTVNPGHALVVFGAERNRVEVTGALSHADSGADVMDGGRGRAVAEVAAKNAAKGGNFSHVALHRGHTSPTNDSAISAIWSSVSSGQYRSAMVRQMPRAAIMYSPSSIDSNDRLRGISWMTIP